MKPHLTILRFSGLSVALLLAAGRARGEGPSDKAAAETLFEQGKLLLNRHELAEACRKFEASESLDPGIGTLLYLGDCYEKLGRTASAWAAFREASSWAAAAGQEQRLTVATARARALEPALVRLTIEVPSENGSLAGFELRRDALLVPPAGYGVSIPVDPGEHRIVATAPDKKPYSEVVTVTQGARRVTVPILTEAARVGATAPGPVRTDVTQSIQARPAASAPLPPAGAEMRPSSPGLQRGVAYALGLAGLVGLGLGSYFGLQAIDRNAKSKDDCRSTDATLCTAQGVSLRQDAQTAATASTIAFTAGGALLASGVLLLLTVPAHSTEKLALHGGEPHLPPYTQVSIRCRW